MNNIFRVATIVILAVSSVSAQRKDIRTYERVLVECPPGGIQEHEACGDDTNGGCDMEPGAESFEPIECGATICGTAWADGGSRDTDWYVLSLSELVRLRVGGWAEFPSQLEIITPRFQDDCDYYQIEASMEAEAGEILDLEATVGPGDVWIRMNDSGFDGHPCGGGDNDYYFVVVCRPCQSFITVEVMTDDYPGETIWYLVHVADRVLVGSGGPYYSQRTLYQSQVCVDDDPTGCYLFTIYDAYGDGICCDYGEGYYNVYDPGGALVCSGGEFDESESCAFGDCAGACCTGVMCEEIDPVTCEAQGGIFHLGESCDTFICRLYPVQQLPNQSNGVFSDPDCDVCNGIQILAENFAIPERSAFSSIIFWGGYYPNDVPTEPDDISVIFRADNDGLPSAEIRSFMHVPAEYKAQTGIVLLGVHEYIYIVRFYPVVTLGPGTFHVELYLNTAGSSESWFWEVGDPDPETGVAGQSYTLTLPEEPWNYDPTTDMAFCFQPSFVPNYMPGDCNHNFIPLELDDVITMIGTYRGTIDSPWHIPCPPHGDNFPPTADPNGNCVANELTDVVTEILAYRGLGDVSGCPDCPPL